VTFEATAKRLLAVKAEILCLIVESSRYLCVVIKLVRRTEAGTQLHSPGGRTFVSDHSTVSPYVPCRRSLSP
jgi:hypothetical protein